MTEYNELENVIDIEEEEEGEDLSFFFADVAEEQAKEVLLVASERFKNKKGEVIPWRFRILTAKEISNYKKEAVRTEKRNGQRITISNMDEMTKKAMVDTIVYPDIKNMSLQDSYGAHSERSLLEKMLTGPELERLGDKFLREQGFLEDINTTIETAKN